MAKSVVRIVDCDRIPFCILRFFFLQHCEDPAPLIIRTPLLSSRRTNVPFRIDVRLEKRWTFTSAAWIAVAFEWFNAAVAKEARDIEFVDGALRVKYESALTVPSLGLEGGF